MEAITETNLELPLFSTGKVRDTYVLDEESLLMIATDRVSAFDVVFKEGIPRKGEVLNKISVYWFGRTKDMIKNHLLTTELPEGVPDYCKGRSMVVRKTQPIKLEAVVRGYITGSGFKEYSKTGSVCGIKLPEGLKNGDKLPEPIFTPSTKADEGHDVNITEEEAIKLVGEADYNFMKSKALEIYKFAHEELLPKGFVLADTKLEFGKMGDEIILIDELLTPDSSRYWEKSEYEKGNLVSLDKQFLRNYLETLDWDKSPPPPPLPAEVVQKLSELYVNTYQKVTGESL